MLQYIALPIVGFVIGMLIVLLGGGGGAIYVGILTVFFNIPPAIAASTSLATIIPTTVMGTFSHWKAGNINLRFGLTMLIGGVIGVIAGSLCSGLLPQNLYNKLTGIVLILLAVQMLISSLKKKQKEGGARGINTSKKSNTVKAICFGILGGAMSGLVGLSGGGPIIAGLMILGCSALETIGTSVLVVLGIATTGFLAHLSLGDIAWNLVGLLSAGTVCGAFAGPFLLKRIDKEKLEKFLQPMLFIMIAVMGGVLMFK